MLSSLGGVEDPVCLEATGAVQLSKGGGVDHGDQLIWDRPGEKGTTRSIGEEMGCRDSGTGISKMGCVSSSSVFSCFNPPSLRTFSLWEGLGSWPLGPFAVLSSAWRCNWCLRDICPSERRAAGREGKRDERQTVLSQLLVVWPSRWDGFAAPLRGAAPLAWQRLKR